MATYKVSEIIQIGKAPDCPDLTQKVESLAASSIAKELTKLYATLVQVKPNATTLYRAGLHQTFTDDEMRKIYRGRANG